MQNDEEQYIDFSDPKYNTYLPEKNVTNPIACRNCFEINEVEEVKTVKPGYRFCVKCYDKMISIGQVIKEFRYPGDDSMILMWEGDPFHHKINDPTRDMFSNVGKVNQ